MSGYLLDQKDAYIIIEMSTKVNGIIVHKNGVAKYFPA